MPDYYNLPSVIPALSVTVQSRNYQNGQDRHHPDLQFLMAPRQWKVTEHSEKNSRRPKVRKAGAQEALTWLRARWLCRN